MRLVRLLLPVAVAACLIPRPATAHGGYPARFQLTEVEPGRYEATFSLPIIEGRKLRAEPVLPPTCEDITPRQTGLTSAGVTTTWQVRCDPASLAGEAIFIEGLLGTQTDLMLQLATLDGRVHTAVLKPSRPGFLVPDPPSVVRLSGTSLVGGMRRSLRVAELWVLLLVAVAVGTSRRELVAGAMLFGVAHAAADWAVAQRWLLVSVHAAPLLLSATALLPAVSLARRGRSDRPSGWLLPLPPLAVLIGVLWGGTNVSGLSPEGLSSAEQSVASFAFTAGLAGGWLLAAAAAGELLRVLIMAAPGRERARVDRLIGYFAGTVAVGLTVLRGSALALVPIAAPTEVWQLGLVTLVAGVGAAAAVPEPRWPWLLAWIGFLAGGLALGLAGTPCPGGALVGGASLFFLGLWLALGGASGRRWWWGLLSSAALVSVGWETGVAMSESVSLPIASGVGAGVAVVCVLYASLRLGEQHATEPVPVSARALGVAAATMSVGLRLIEYRLWFDDRVVTEAALGTVRIPLAALLVAIGAVLLWPKRRRGLAELGIEVRRSAVHWIALAVAFYLIPLGTVSIHNPLYHPHAPEGEDARRVVESVLSNTYSAFNIADEEDLYRELAQNVTGNLVEDLYLDSRRRLRAGTRQGAEVTVRDVSVLDLGQSVAGVDGPSGFSYDCRWVVTARVRHLQHVHHRQNIYSGVLTIRVDGDRWKIAGVDLRSEDRVVLSWRQT